MLGKRVPCTFIASLSRTDRGFVGCFSPFAGRAEEAGRMSDLGDQDGLQVRQPLVSEATSPRNKVTRVPSLVRLKRQMLTRRLCGDRH